MDRHFESVEDRISGLERSLRRTRFTLRALGCAILLAVAVGFMQAGTETADELRTRRLVVVDDAGHERIVLAQDPPTTQRASRATGMTLFDDKGGERGGFTTMADGSVVLAMDAPVGTGAPMRDRIGLKVHPDGSAYVMLIDNQTRAVAKLESDGAGGGVQVFKWDMDAKQIHIRTLTYDGDVRDSVPFGP
jgi:hypothetical protein